MKYLGTYRPERGHYAYEVFSLTENEAYKVRSRGNHVAVRYHMVSDLTHVFDCEVFDTHFNTRMGGLIQSEVGCPSQCFSRRGVYFD